MFGPSIQHRVSEFLKTGYAVEAAQLLVASREQRYHKDLRPLVRDCIEQLMLDATAAFDGRNLIVALESAKLAEQLLSLKNEHALLLSKIEAAVEEQQSAKSWEEQRLQQAQQFQEQGRFDTAIESLGSLQNRAEAHRLHLDVVGAKRQFERYLAELRQSLDDGKLHHARVIMEKANRLSPNHPALIELKIALNESAKNSASHEYAGSSPVSSRRGGLLLDFEDPKNNTVVVFGEKTVIGEGSWARDAWSTVEVSFANGSDLGRQHAMILKHTRQGVTEFHLVIHPSSDDAERVVGIRKASSAGTARRILRNRVGENGSIDCVPLKHGDIIELGNCRDDQTVIAYRFRFHRPFAEGSTESIDAEPSSFQSDVVVPSPNTAVLSILSEAGSHEFFEIHPPQPGADLVKCSHIVLMHDQLLIGGNPQHCHLQVDKLPDEQMEYRWIGRYLSVDACQSSIGCLSHFGENVTRESCNSSIPDRFVVMSNSTLTLTPWVGAAPQDRMVRIRQVSL